MSVSDGTPQRILGLAPLCTILDQLDQIASEVSKLEIDCAQAVGKILAEDIAADAGVPAAATALRDGWAVAADATIGASPYAPAILAPPPVWIETGELLPAGCDAILPAEAATVTARQTETQTQATSGEGVMAAGANAVAGRTLRRAGELLRASDVAVLRALDIRSIAVRVPRIKVLSIAVASGGAKDVVSPLIAHAVSLEGCEAEISKEAALEKVLQDASCDAIVTIGGTGAGRNDRAVTTLAKAGKLAFHGFGIYPGETAALGSAGGKPVLMLPGRLDAALAVFLVVGRALLSRLSGRRETDAVQSARLSKKIASTVGIAEVVLLQRSGNEVAPLGSGVLSWQSLAQADGWMLVPPESEGFAAGTQVEMSPLP